MFRKVWRRRAETECGLHRAFFFALPRALEKRIYSHLLAFSTYLTPSCCISIGWLENVGHCSCCTERWSPSISDTSFFVYLWGQDHIKGRPSTWITMWHILEPWQNNSPQLSQNGHLKQFNSLWHFGSNSLTWHKCPPWGMLAEWWSLSDSNVIYWRGQASHRCCLLKRKQQDMLEHLSRTPLVVIRRIWQR